MTQKNREMGTVTAASINDRRERMREQNPGPSTPTRRNVRFIIYISPHHISIYHTHTLKRKWDKILTVTLLQ